MSKDTSQKERIPDALSPEYFQIDDRSLRDFYLEVQELAEALVFYETSDEEATADWSAFFDEAAFYLQKITSEEWESDFLQQNPSHCPPHLGLFLTFLKLFGHTQHQLNALTSSHLHFFYHKILSQEKRGVKPDKVYVFFELARNIDKYLLPRRAPLLAGKDHQGKDILYTTDRKLFLHHAKVTRFKAIHHQKASDSSIYSFPIANSLDSSGSPLKEGQGWYPFGNPKMRSVSAEIGLGIGSPMLFLKEGVRTIQVSFFLPDYNNIASEINTLKPEEFEALLTGPEQWFSQAVKAIRYQDGKLTFVIQLNEVDPPVVAFNQNMHEYQMDNVDWPLLKIILKQDFTYSRYAFIQSLQFTRVTMKVEVEKVRSLLVRNDFGETDANRAFQPFGYSPVLGANLYLGLEETFYKPVTAYTVQIKWKGLPEDFKVYYEGYLGPTNSLVRNQEDFKVKAAIQYQREWLEIKNKTSNSMEFPLFAEALQLDTGNYPKEKATPYREMSREDGLLRLTLSSPSHAFGHALYPTVYAKAIMSQLQDKASPIPNEPYTPIIDSIDLAYSSEEDIDFTKAPSTSFRFFHIEPFGINESTTEKPASFKSYALLSGEFHHAGSLYLGLENLHPPQQLAIFFEVEEEIIQDKPDLEFYYLSKTGWHYLSENQVLSDTTLGLKQTGILVLNLPDDLTSENSRMPLGYHWIRVSIPGNPESFDRILSVRTNAVSCTLNYNPSLVGLEVNALPPGSIKSFSRKIGEIKQIEQPYSSFGGRPAEKEMNYFTRVSEKLRHKMRSITSWDMERLILEQFPEIYKVKCIQHTDANGLCTPGSIHIIVIPLIKRFDQSKILKPLMPNSTLTEIREYIERLSSPHASIQVTNPHYEEIKIVALVSFNIQVDAGFYLKQLQSDLQYFLSPWAFQEDVEIQLGGKLYRSSIIEYIESRHYVNFIASIKLLKNDKVIHDHEISPDERTIIVSSDTHDIEAVESDRVVCQTNQGIEQMIVDINFEVQ